MAVIDADPRFDTKAARSLARAARKSQDDAQKRLTSRGATIAAIIIAIIWTLPDLRAPGHLVPPRRRLGDDRMVDRVRQAGVHARRTTSTRSPREERP